MAAIGREEGVLRLDLPLGPGPLQAFKALRDRGGAPFIFETLGPRGPAILGFDPIGSVEESGGRTRAIFVPRVSGTIGSPRGRRATDVMEAVIRRLGRSRPDPTIPFTGGFAGFFSYEWSAAQEGPDAPREPGVPDLWFGLYDRALVFHPGTGPMLVLDPRVQGLSRSEADSQTASIARDLVAFSGRSEASTAPITSTAPPKLSSDFPRARFEAAVRRARKHIRKGDIYQANIAHRTRTTGVDPLALYESLRRTNPSPFMGLIDCGGFTIVSGSPERLVQVVPEASGGRSASSRPIAGTRPRARGAEDERMERRLRDSVKERAEHVMLVDLERNDLGRVCDKGSVEVDELFTVERYSHVMHLVSDVRGRLRDDVRLSDLARAMLPGGTVTGCPKIRAMEIIHDIEPVARGAYTGSMGYFSLNGRIDLNILIRSAYFPRNRGALPPHSRVPPPPHASHGECHIYAGAGIVQDSRPGREWRETLDKAEALLAAIGSGEREGMAWRAPRRIASWTPPHPVRSFEDAQVLVIDNYDSFTYNLVQYIAAAGARVEVVRNDVESVGKLLARMPTHLVISPGPGTPRRSGVSIEAVRAFEGTPILGVCLGLQAIVEAYGGRVAETPVPVHGKSSVVRRAPPREGQDILSSLPREFHAGRYHSLAAVKVRPPVEVTAVTRDGVVMAVRHRDAPTFGVQFHPESVLTPMGMKILEEFLALGRRGDPGEDAVRTVARRSAIK